MMGNDGSHKISKLLIQLAKIFSLNRQSHARDWERIFAKPKHLREVTMFRDVWCRKQRIQPFDSDYWGCKATAEFRQPPYSWRIHVFDPIRYTEAMRMTEVGVAQSLDHQNMSGKRWFNASVFQSPVASFSLASQLPISDHSLEFTYLFGKTRSKIVPHNLNFWYSQHTGVPVLSSTWKQFVSILLYNRSLPNAGEFKICQKLGLSRSSIPLLKISLRVSVCNPIVLSGMWLTTDVYSDLMKRHEPYISSTP